MFAYTCQVDQRQSKDLSHLLSRKREMSVQLSLNQPKCLLLPAELQGSVPHISVQIASTSNTSKLRTVLTRLPFGTTGPGIPKFSLMNTLKNEGELHLQVCDEEGTVKTWWFFSTFAEVSLLEDNDEFSRLIAGIEMPTVLRDTISLHGYSK